jgi:hypothetical protein
MFERPYQHLAPAGHVEFQDEQGDGDRENAIRERLQTAGGQQAAA